MYFTKCWDTKRCYYDEGMCCKDKCWHLIKEKKNELSSRWNMCFNFKELISCLWINSSYLRSCSTLYCCCLVDLNDTLQISTKVKQEHHEPQGYSNQVVIRDKILHHVASTKKNMKNTKKVTLLLFFPSLQIFLRENIS